ncbi:MAG: glycosylase, partial [Sediminibacterium sp.]
MLIKFMKNKSIIYLLICVIGTIQCKPSQKNISSTNFPSELVNFVPYKNNPVFTGAGPNDWDKQIRERGYILKEGNA